MRHVPDPYRALGLSRGATEAEIKAAHRRLAKRYHPDSAGGDTDRFLMVQEAYSLLTDPLRRREWDARHAPGPVRASDPARARGRDRRWTRAEQGAGPASGPAPGPAAGPARAADPRTASGRDPGSRTYTWSASDVPWWEEGGARESRRRQPGRKRPRERPGQPAAEETARPGAWGEGAATAEAPTGEAPTGEAPTGGPDISGTQDFDVYNRSSGAAWSMAARAYFRRGDFELPRRGSFRHQGSQPLTAARARAAAEEEKRRARAEASAASTSPAWPGDGPQARPSGAGERQAAVGTVRDAERINEVRSSARERALAARWPTMRQRLLYALVAWLPMVLIVGYGGAWAAGCELGSPDCPPQLPYIQAGAAISALLLLLLVPRVAYALTIALAAVAVVGLAIGILAPRVLVLATPLLILAQLVVAAWVLSTGAAQPWAVARTQRLNPRKGR